MLRHTLTATLLFGVLAAIPSLSHARMACAERSSIVTGLGAKFGETHIGGGLQSETQMVEVWMSQSTGSFTILVTTPDGQSCIVSSGNNWTTYEPRALKVGVPS